MVLAALLATPHSGMFSFAHAALRRARHALLVKYASRIFLLEHRENSLKGVTENFHTHLHPTHWNNQECV